MEHCKFMTFQINKLPDMPVVLLTLSSEYNLATDFPNSYAEALALLDNMDEPVYYLNDFTDANFDLEDIIRGSNMTSRDSGGTYHHPNVREVLFVSPSPVIHEATKGLTSKAFGHVSARA
jgi:hypothetical protein